MIGFKRIRQRFYLIVGLILGLMLIAYVQLAVFMKKLSAIAEEGLVSAVISKDIKNLEKKFWKLRLWGRLAYDGHAEADNALGNILGNIRKGIHDFNHPSVPKELYDKFPEVSALITEYENAFVRLMKLETDRKQNRANIDSGYRTLTSAILANHDTDMFASLQNTDRLLSMYFQNRGDSEYQSLRISLDLLRTKLATISDIRIDSYLSDLDNCLSSDFGMKKQIMEINNEFDAISMRLTILLSYLSQTAERLSSDAIWNGKNLQTKLELLFLISAGLFFILVMLILNLIALTIVNPINTLLQVIREVKAGNETARFSSSSEDELAELGFAFNDMLEKVNQHRFHLEELVDQRTSALVEANHQMQISNRELEIAKKDADAANKAKSEFLANMSHEIRTPMNAILGFSEILMGKATDEQQKQYLKTILSSGETLLALINDILDLSKIEAGKLELEYEPVRIRRILIEIEQMFFQRAQKKGIELKTEISDAVPHRLVLDEIRTRQILINLVGNAVKFTSEGLVTVSAYGDISDETGQCFDLILEVRDTGIGIPEDQQSLIFESFRQQEGQSTRHFGGTGLGLTITKRLTEMMNGSISVESQVGKGSSFQIRFRRVTIPESAESPENEFQLQDIHVNFKPATLLIADDIRNNRDLVKGYLENSGLNLIEADSGDMALHILAHQIPDLIFMDLRMPGKDGYETTEKIRQNEKFSSIPIVALTASAMKNAEERIRNLFDGYLRKPISKTALIEELKKFLPYTSENGAAETVLSGNDIQLSSEISGEQRIEIVQALNNMLPEWEEISDTFFIDDIAAFAKKIGDTARKYNFGLLSEFGRKLHESARSNNIADMERLMSEFPDIIRKMGVLRK